MAAMTISNPFKLVSEFQPSGDQPAAIRALTTGLQKGLRDQVLLGVTGSGKTFTMANVIQQLQRPALIIAHNKTLAAQLFREFKELFPENAVDYFVSYYDYYQPEAFIPATATYIEKDSAINDELEKMRLAATMHLIGRRDVIIVASVSCIYGIGAPEDYAEMVVLVEEGQKLTRERLMRSLIEILYERNDRDFSRGTFRVRGDVVDVYPAHADRDALRIEFFGDEVEAVWEIDALTGQKKARLRGESIWPTSNYVTRKDKLERAMKAIREELEERHKEFLSLNKLVEAERVRQRTEYDLELLREMGTCKGIENYSRHLAGRPAGASPTCLLDYFPKDFLLFVDESHVTVPQLNGMFNGDRARKQVLVDHGFRLPSALDNRPLRFEEFLGRVGQTVYVSATPSEWEKQRAGGLVVEQLIRPTGLIDPEIEIRPAQGQVDDLLGLVREHTGRGGRILVTTLTKRMAEELSEYYLDVGVKVKYLHSDVTTIERTALIRELREGKIDVLVGVNLLREGLDIPEVTLVAILDADKEGFLRSPTALVQTCGRAARNLDGRVVMYADRVTDSMKFCLSETARRRERQTAYNAEHNIVPRSIAKKMGEMLNRVRYESDEEEASTSSAGTPSARGRGRGKQQGKARQGGYAAAASGASSVAEDAAFSSDPRALARRLNELRGAMKAAASELRFEDAARLRDEFLALEKRVLVDLA